MQDSLFAAAGVFLLLLLASNALRHIFRRHARAHGAEMAAAETAGWLMFCAMAFLGAAALGVLNLSKFLNLALSSTLLVFGLAALVGALLIGRR
ncbi:hypothetical protein [Pseudoduganella sp.]|uniref:hypothetical protein n=1 Tax=Pseudoduganella sp. TaxID=1880898 RepID=UPI0035AEB5E1